MRSPAEERAFWEKVDPSVDYERCIFDGPEEHGVDRILGGLSSPPGPWFELGCGTGRLTNRVALSAPGRVDGFDISARRATLARLGSAMNAYFTRSDGRTIPAPDESFAGGWSVLLFQHLEPDAVRGYLREVARVLRPGGRFVFQFAYDPQGSDAPYSWNHHPWKVWDWCDAVRLVLVGAEEGGVVPMPGDDDLYPTWCWLTVEKP